MNKPYKKRRRNSYSNKSRSWYYLRRYKSVDDVAYLYLIVSYYQQLAGASLI